jgi:hypothetical protein
MTSVIYHPFTLVVLYTDHTFTLDASHTVEYADNTLILPVSFGMDTMYFKIWLGYSVHLR